MIAVTGATGHLGRLVMQQLLQKVAPAELVALVRRPEAAADLVATGVDVRRGDYDDPQSLQEGLRDVSKLLLISSNAMGQRIEQHRAAIDAALKAGVRHIAYTSIPDAQNSPLELATEHKATEDALQDSGIAFTLLRNGWYTENHLAGIGAALAHGAILGSAGDGRFATAPRSDYAAAAVAVLTGSGHENKVYELNGDMGYTLAELAAEIARQSGKPVTYQDMSADTYTKALISFGLPASVAGGIADADEKARTGALDVHSHDLSALIGRPTVPMPQSVAKALAQPDAQG